MLSFFWVRGEIALTAYHIDSFLLKLIYFPPIYCVSFRDESSYTHKFPQHFFPICPTILCTQKISSENGGPVATYLAVEEPGS